MGRRASRGSVVQAPPSARAPVIYEARVDDECFRRTLGHYATGVAILTAVTQAGEHLGITVNSFTSVSLDPPLVSVCLGKLLASLSRIKAARCFNINILCRGQEALSAQFARAGTEKWQGVCYEVARNGVRTVRPNLAVLECSRYRVYPAGDHHILLGRVECVRINAVEEPLLFYRGEYRTLTDAASRADWYGAWSHGF